MHAHFLTTMKMCTISLIFREENISESSTSAAKLIIFIKFYIKICDIFGLYLYVKIT